jgi:nucleoside-diphosphate-sugar epimerase
MTRRILLTGSTGFLGNHLRTFLSEKDVDLYYLGINHHDLDNYYQIRVEEFHKLPSILQDIKPEAIIHLAGQTNCNSLSEAFTVNVLFADAIIHSMQVSGMNNSQLILIGSAAEYGQITPNDLPIDEALSPKPYNYYGFTKLAQTELGKWAIRIGMRVKILRPFNIFGYKMPKQLLIQSVIEQIKLQNRSKLVNLEIGNLTTSRDFIYVTDVVRILWKLLDEPIAEGKIINVCTGKPIQVASILRTIEESMGIKFNILQSKNLIKPNDINLHYGSRLLLDSLIGRFDFTPFEEAIDLTLKQEGLL